MIAAARSLPTIRPARPEDAGFIARTILAAQRGPVPRGWFDIALELARTAMPCLCRTDRPRADAILVARLAIHHCRGRRESGRGACAPCPRPVRGVAARSAIAEVAGETGLSASRAFSDISARRLRRELLGTGRRGRLADRACRHTAGLSRPRACAGVDRPRARGRQGCRLRAGVDLVSDRQRSWPNDAMPRPVLCSPRRSGIRSSKR